MSGPAEILPVISANPNIVRTPYADALALNPGGIRAEFEQGAAGHWCFDREDATNLVDRVNGRLLTPQGSAPTHGVKKLTTGVNGNALLTDIDDCPDYTIYGVLDWPDQGGGEAVSFGGTLAASGGCELLIGAGASNELLSYREGVTNFGLNLSSTPTEGQSVFVAMTLNFQGSAVARVLSAMGQTVTVDGDTDYVVTAGRKIHLGPFDVSELGAPYTTTPLVVREFIVFTEAHSAGRHAEVRALAIARWARRGVTVL